MSAYPEAAFLASAHRPAQFLPDEGAEVAFAGRSNSGKSSAINAIVGRKGLARTSKTPGRTQLVNFFSLGGNRRITDLPGYGYARVPESVRRHWDRLMDAYFRTRRSLAGLFLVMDVRHPLTDFDRHLLAWAGAAGCPVHILLTKADKLSRGRGIATLQAVRRELGPGVSLQLFSALKGTGIDEAREALDVLLGTNVSAGQKEAPGA
jgi:GTP-binding protein